MITKSLILISIITLNYLFADVEHGKELFDEAKCVSCHNYEDFKHKKRKANTFDKLYNSVSNCAFNDNVAWFDDETMDVASYLNTTFYFYKVSSK